MLDVSCISKHQTTLQDGAIRDRLNDIKFLIKISYFIRSRCQSIGKKDSYLTTFHLLTAFILCKCVYMGNFNTIQKRVCVGLALNRWKKFRFESENRKIDSQINTIILSLMHNAILLNIYSVILIPLDISKSRNFFNPLLSCIIILITNLR